MQRQNQRTVQHVGCRQIIDVAKLTKRHLFATKARQRRPRSVPSDHTAADLRRADRPRLARSHRRSSHSRCSDRCDPTAPADVGPRRPRVLSIRCLPHITMPDAKTALDGATFGKCTAERVFFVCRQAEGDDAATGHFGCRKCARRFLFPIDQNHARATLSRRCTGIFGEVIAQRSRSSESKLVSSEIDSVWGCPLRVKLISAMSTSLSKRVSRIPRLREGPTRKGRKLCDPLPLACTSCI